MTHIDKADGLTFDTFVVRPDGELDMVSGRSQPAGEELKVSLRFAGTLDEKAWFTRDQLRLATYFDFAKASLGTPDEVRGTTAARKGAVTTGKHGSTRGSGAHVLTPCCDAGRYIKATQESVACPDCLWMYGVAFFSTSTFWVSLGWGKERRPSPKRRA